MRKVLHVTYRELRASVVLDDDAPSSSCLPVAQVVETVGEDISPRPLRKASGIIRLDDVRARRTA